MNYNTSRFTVKHSDEQFQEAITVGEESEFHTCLRPHVLSSMFLFDSVLIQPLGSLDRRGEKMCRME